MSVTIQGKNVPIQMWVKNASDVESSALDQLKNVAALPWIYHHVAVMPDVHYGKGATVGSVIAMKDAICPAAVGVDIGCGMIAQRLSVLASDLPDNLERLRSRIEQLVPVGFASHEKFQPNSPVRPFMASPGCPSGSGSRWAAQTSLSPERFRLLTPEVHGLRDRAVSQVGTLGGGNHFIELCLDTDDGVWIVLHSGSRHIGKALAEIHMARAAKLLHNAKLPDRDLSVFLADTPEIGAYRHDLYWAQNYALLNRAAILAACIQACKELLPPLFHAVPPQISCHHNYVTEEEHFGEVVYITRKGAINAAPGAMGIIPGSMGTDTYIVRGKGCADSFNSASHGAGRRMSRGAAKRAFTLTDLEGQTAGVCCRKDQGVLDEIPGAYKDIGEVMANQTDLVEVVARLHQVLCVKG